MVHMIIGLTQKFDAQLFIQRR